MAKEYYTVDCILFLLKNVHLPHAMYVRQAAVSIFIAYAYDSHCYRSTSGVGSNMLVTRAHIVLY